MGSLQQIFLGAICVGGAFLMGHYLNHQTPTSSPFENRAGTEPIQMPQDGSRQKETTAMLPKFRTQSKLGPMFGQDQELPPPSELEVAPTSPNPSAAVRTPNQLDLTDQELDIEVPDFSALAAQFKGTALELPALDAAPNVAAEPHQTSSEFDRREIALPAFNRANASASSNFDHGNSPHVPAKDEVKVPNFRTTINPVEEQLRAERARAAFDSSVNDSTETSFRPEDFAPRLRADNPAVEYKPMLSNPESDEEFSPTDLSQVSPFPQQSISVLETDRRQPTSQDLDRERHPNAVISYNDRFPSVGSSGAVSQSSASGIQPSREIGSGATSNQANSTESPAWNRPEPVEAARNVGDATLGQWSVREREAPAQFETALQPGGAYSAEMPAEGTKPRMPFGLNEGEKSRLFRLNPAPSEAGEATTRFKEYKTEVGDTLTTISKKFYGKPEYYLDIYLANRQQLRNPAEVPVGIILQIPVYE